MPDPPRTDSRPARALPRDPADRPRERMLRLGPRALAHRELVAVLLGSGTRGRSALGIADLLLQRSPDGLSGLAGLEPAAADEIPGIGTATVLRVMAAVELGRRVSQRGGEGPRSTVRGPADVFRFVGPGLRELRQEEFHVLLLDTRHRVRRQVLVTRGILDGSLIHPREVFRPAIGEGCSAVVLVHNHPSGDPSPSEEDRAVTRRLAEAGRTLGIHVLDHVIVGDGRYVSLAEYERERGEESF